MDPGGFLRSNLEPREITIYYLISFLLVIIIYAYNYNIHKINVFKFKFIKIYLWILFIWYLYYFLIFFGINNKFYENFFNSILDNFVLVYTSLLVIPIVYFSFFGLKIFLKILVWSTIIIGLLFLVTVFTNVELIKTWSAIRGEAGNLTRHFLYGYGLMFYIVPLTIAILFLKVRLDKRVLLSFLIVIMIILITVYRREIIALMEYIVIIAFLSSKVEGKNGILSITKYFNPKTILITILTLFFLSVFSKEILNTSLELINNTLINLGLIQNDNLMIQDVRLSLSGKTGIIKAISDHFFLGTGFDPVWYTGDGGVNQWEGADYVFLAALAMYGIMGLLAFFPFYIFVLTVIYKFVLLSRNHFESIIKSQRNIIFLLIGIAAISEFIKNLIEYPNWFYPIGAIMDRGKYYIFLGLILGCYYNLNNNFSVKKDFYKS